MRPQGQPCSPGSGAGFGGWFTLMQQQQLAAGESLRRARTTGVLSFSALAPQQPPDETCAAWTEVLRHKSGASQGLL